MHTGTLRKCALALTFWLALHMSSLRAQIFTAPLQASTTGTNPVDFEFRADGTMIAKGNYSVGSLLSGDQGSGTRLLWFPSLGAFRAGTVDSTQWDSSHVGAYSAALNFDTTASGSNSTASGYKTLASGYASLSANISTTASGGGSVALGHNSTASGYCAAALNVASTASGNYAIATGYITTASGGSSSSSGAVTYATGNNSTAAGSRTSVSAYDCFSVGAGNVGGGNTSTWIATDPLFEVGNGKRYGSGNPSATGTADALVVYKNGTAKFQGAVTIAPGGDIPMYTGY